MAGTRRDTLKFGIAGLLAPAGIGQPAGDVGRTRVAWPRGVENQRRPDLGDGTFLNPIMSGDHPDPTILKDGDDYYMTFSSFDAYPGVIIWHSHDLVNWQPVVPALQKVLGIIFAVDLVKHDGRFYIYIPVIPKVLTAGTRVKSHVPLPWALFKSTYGL